ncbi:hypothetical protein [Sandaracinus amylolyticus]|uniref:hypothetical protein n=1 Tax=Sandaracinus amylolyticus TaxID=927083 RepID=UPI001F2300FC|nr:hypothetical protein [Sandaracinus amylolyticus]
MTSAKKSTAAAKSAASKPGRAPAAPAKKSVPSKAAVEKPTKPVKAAAAPKTAKAAAPVPAAKKATPLPKQPAKTMAKPEKVAKPEKAEKAEKVAAEKAGGSEPPPAPAPAAGLAKPTAPRLTVRTPVGADELKQKIGALATATANIRNLKRSLQRSFYDIGLILKDIDERKLYEVKGYGSFEAFLEREIDLGKQLGLRLARAVQVFQREAATQAGLDRVSAAIAVFDGEVDPSLAPPPGTAPTSSGGARSPIPFHKL